jgi:hypothetical protein
MSINPTRGIAPAYSKFTHPKPALGDILACTDYVHHAVQLSTNSNYTLAFIWARFLVASFLQEANQ